MSTKLQKIDYAIYHDPRLIPTLLRDCSIKKGLIYSRLRRAVPRRVGIEFECIGNPASTYKYGWRKSISHANQLKDEFHLTDYSQDSGIARSEAEYIREFNELNSNKKRDASIDELRVSIQDYRQLIGLADILKLFGESCRKPIGGGIHIHIDFSSYNLTRTRAIAQKYITAHLDEVEQIFPEYDGTYNKRKVGFEQKATYVNLSYHGTIEFRIAPLTFDYETLIKWIIDCNKFVTKVIHECHLLTDEEVEKRRLDKLKTSDPSLMADANSRSSWDYISRDELDRIYHVFTSVRGISESEPHEITDNIEDEGTTRGEEVLDDQGRSTQDYLDDLAQLDILNDEIHQLRSHMRAIENRIHDGMSYDEYRSNRDTYRHLSRCYHDLQSLASNHNTNYYNFDL